MSRPTNVHAYEEHEFLDNAKCTNIVNTTGICEDL